MSSEKIINAIRRLALENGGAPVGERRFLTSLGLTRSAIWSAGFANYGDALMAAGFSKNQRTPASDPKAVLSSLVALMRNIGRFPTKGHIKAARAKDSSFPSYEAFLTVSGGAFSNLPGITRKFCENSGISDVAHLIPPDVSSISANSKNISGSVNGFVYLLKHGQHYKIGRTNDTARRRREVSLLLPEELEHVHVIETDDPEGIEAYWHRRFSTKHVRGEWFALAREDVLAFKRRRYQ